MDVAPPGIVQLETLLAAIHLKHFFVDNINPGSTRSQVKTDFNEAPSDVNTTLDGSTYPR